MKSLLSRLRNHQKFSQKDLRLIVLSLCIIVVWSPLFRNHFACSLPSKHKALNGSEGAFNKNDLQTQMQIQQPSLTSDQQPIKRYLTRSVSCFVSIVSTAKQASFGKQITMFFKLSGRAQHLLRIALDRHESNGVVQAK